MMSALAVMIAIAVGSCMQRVSGMGVGLISGPIISIILGPVEGIMVLNILACINAGATTLTVRQNVDWRQVRLISTVLIFGSIPAAFFIAAMDTAPLLIVVGALLLVALATVTLGKRLVPPVSGRAPAQTAGVVGGFTNTLAGVAGPVFTVYFTAAKTPQAVLAATLQPLFMVSGAISFLIKIALGTAGFDSVNPLVWIGGLCGMLIGISLGGAISGRIEQATARKFSLLVAAAGSIVAIIRGISSL